MREGSGVAGWWRGTGEGRPGLRFIVHDPGGTEKEAVGHVCENG